VGGTALSLGLAGPPLLGPGSGFLPIA
jgi:hypothetical protein